MSKREILLGLIKELFEKHKVRGGAIELCPISVLVDTTYCVSIINGLGRLLVTFQKISYAKKGLKTLYLDDLIYGCFSCLAAPLGLILSITTRG
jgi:hypothetical protein